MISECIRCGSQSTAKAGTASTADKETRPENQRREGRGAKTNRQAEKMENLEEQQGRNSANEPMALENISYFLKAAATSAESHTIFLPHISTFAFLVANEEVRAEDQLQTL